MEKKKKSNKVFEGIDANKSIEVIKRLKQFRVDGKPNQISEIINVLNKNKNEEVRNTIFQILNDLKDKEAIPYLMEEIKKSEKTDFQHFLVSACWQNGLDFGDYFEYFIDLMCTCNYLTSIEVFTVIEVMEKNYSEEELTESINKLKSKISSFSEEKQFLVKELLHHLETKKMVG